LNNLNRFVVREGRLMKIGRIFKQKGVDILLAIDVIKLVYSGKIDRIILITGDSDFVPVVESVRDSGVTVSLYRSPQDRVHRSLWQAVDERFDITDDLLQKHAR